MWAFAQQSPAFLPPSGTSPNNFMEEITDAINDVANAIHPKGMGGHDKTGTYVTSLTEAVGGMTSALIEIANAIREHSQVFEPKVAHSWFAELDKDARESLLHALEKND